MGSTAAPRTRRGDGARAPAVHERFVQRAAGVRRRPRRLLLWSAVVAALVAAVAVLLLWSPAFVVEEVRVSGVEEDMVSSVRQDAALPLGVPLARVDTEAAATRVEQDLRVADADVRRSWPSGVTVDVTLREPAVAVQAPGGPAFEIADAGGVVFGQAAARPDDLPVVRVEGPDASAEDIGGALALLAALPEDLRDRVAVVALAPDGALRFRVGGIVVQWGSGAEPELKSRVLQALLAQEAIDPSAEEPVGIDLAVPGTPVVTGLPPATDED